MTDRVTEMSCSKCNTQLNVSAYATFCKVACPQCRAELTVPGKLGPFLLLDILGRGGMGVAYRGFDEQLNRQVAIKVMLRSYGEDPEFVKTFRREAQAAAALNHVNVVQIYSFGVEKGQPYIVMELLTGGRLDAMIAKGEQLNEAFVMKVGADVADGLNAANAIGLIHGDVKPENILLDANGTAKVVDFGLAYFKHREAGPEGIWGTPYYIAPEKVRRQPNDARADLYSLGATLFHALALSPPFEGETPLDVIKARLVNPPPKLSGVRPGCNTEVERIITRMLEPEPSRRYPNYASLLSDIRQLLTKLGPVTQKRASRVVMTKKKSSSGAVGSGTIATASSKISGQVGEAMDLSTPVLGLADTVPPEKRRKKNIILAVSFGLLALLILGAIGVTMWRMEVKKEKARQDALEQARQEHQAILTSGNSVYTNFTVVLSNIFARIEASQKTIQASGSRIAELQAKAQSGNSAAATTAAGTAADLLKQIVTRVDKLTNTVGGLRQREQIGASKFLIMTRTKSAAEAQAEVQQLTAVAAEVDEVWKVVQEVDGKTSELTNQIAVAQEKLKTDKTAADQEAARLAAEKAEQDRKAAEEKDAQRKAEEQRKLAAKEKETIGEAVKKNLDLIRKNEFIDATAALEASLNEIVTEEGKAARQAALDRCAQLEKLRTFFVESLQKETKDKGSYPYGWMGNLDILGASATAVEVRGSKVAWNKVPIQQIVTFIRHYIKDAQELSRKERAAMSLAAAVYFYESAGGDKRALAQASRYAGDAITLDAGLKGETERLMPDLALP